MITPSVGRVVWYYSYVVASQSHVGPLAAIVAKVHDDKIVNLTVCQEHGETFGKLKCPLIQEGEAPPQSDYCCWMPYQIGQAKKAEALEAELKETVPAHPEPLHASHASHAPAHKRK